MAGMSEQERDERRRRLWATLCHMAALPGFLLPPLVGIALWPLVAWLWKGGEWDFVDRHGREAVNFQLSMLLLFIPVIALMVFLPDGLWVLAMGVSVFDVVCVLLASKEAIQGKEYRYPLSYRFIG
jgi:hypothetical protein